ncbi:IclR family transcriptional regulator [Streptomyces sp. NPDC058867]|uniref:IclR family transcriptional regulator n=1 Tax=unclassified Streptomyces TaxID=2593676 RepID=UPI0036C11647
MNARRETSARSSSDESVRDAGGVRAVARAARILTVLADHPHPLGVVELAKLVDLSPASVHRILSTLVSVGWVGQNSRTTKYRLGMRAIGVGMVGLATNPVVHEGRAYLTRLAKWSGYEAALSTLTGVKTVQVARVPAPGTDVVEFDPIRPQPAHAMAEGKLLLAFLPEDELNYLYEVEGLKRFTVNSIGDRLQMDKELETIRSRGYAIDNFEHSDSVRGIAVPVLGANDLPIAAMSCTGKIDPARDRDIIQQMQALSRALSDDLKAAGDMPAPALGYILPSGSQQD